MFKKIYEKYASITNGLAFSAIPLISFYLMEFYEHNPFVEVRAMAAFFNIILFELIAWIFYIFTGKAKWALRIVLSISMIFGLINHYVTLFRSTPFVPWDIFSIGTATSVASNYDFTPSTNVVIVTLIFVALIILVRFWDFKMEMKFRYRIIPGVAVILCLCIFVNRLQDEKFQTRFYLYPFLFTPSYMTKVNGMAVTFAMDLGYIAVDKPSGYSQEKAQKILEEYEEPKKSQSDDYPNIIVVMDEGFSDLSVLGNLETNVDYMPFVHSLIQGEKNTVSGKLNVSVCGGNTANSEFEFLTGDSMYFLPQGSIPYQQYIKDEIPSMASHLSELGYETYAQHPYNSTGWDRDTVYPNMGFENVAFISDYTSRKYIRDYISDESSFQKIIDTYENKPQGKPAFIFNVTMQNHGGYNNSYDNFEPDVQVEGLSNGAVEQYLSLIKRTDSDFENLINYFNSVDEKTVIVFFGDHQPNDAVAGPILAQNGIDVDNMTQTQLYSRYEVPYVIWANFDIDEGTNRDTSLNYLGANVLDLADVPKSDYQNFLLELQKDYPVISALRIESSGKKPNEQMLEDYHILQYYHMFD